MAARAALVSLIATDPQMQMLGFEEEVIYGSNAMDTPSRTRPFCIHKWDSVEVSGGLPVYIASVWFHIPQEIERDYGKIDLAILRLRELMKEVAHHPGDDGWVLVSATWIGSSPDLPDDGYNSLTRFAQFRCACRNVA